MTNSTRMDRSARLMWVKLGDMKVSPIAQREKQNRAHVEEIAREFDPDKFDAPKINLRDGTHWIVDGSHRCEAATIALGADQAVQCWVRQDLTDAEAAEWSIGLNNYRGWSALDRFKIRITAERDREADIDRIVRAHGLTIGHVKEGGVGCVSTLVRIYDRAGPGILARTLDVVTGAYGDAGCSQHVLDGLALLCQRYNGRLNPDTAIERLGRARGGVDGLLGKARAAHKQRLGSLPHCVAASAVEIINAGQGGKKLPVWWKS